MRRLRNRVIVFLRGRGWTYQRIGDLFHISKQRAHQIYITKRPVEQEEDYRAASDNTQTISDLRNSGNP